MNQFFLFLERSLHNKHQIAYNSKKSIHKWTEKDVNNLEQNKYALDNDKVRNIEVRCKVQSMISVIVSFIPL